MVKYRYGGNIYHDDSVSDIGDLYPSAVVEKVGRTSGTIFGTVNPASLVVWDQGYPTFEIAITGMEGDTFARVGDSGGCVFENQDVTYKAAGLLIGRLVKSIILLMRCRKNASKRQLPAWIGEIHISSRIGSLSRD